VVKAPSTRDLILRFWRNNGAWGPPRRYAEWMGRPVAEVRAELERMEGDGLARRWHERPGLEWRFGPPD
jgi:hypothetical protein